MTTTLLPERITRPIRLTLGEMIGIEMQRHYEIGLFVARRLARVEQYPQIGLLHPPGLYAALPPSTCLHTFRPYVVDLGDAHVAQRQQYYDDAWRYDWYTQCKRFALRISGEDDRVMLAGVRCVLYDHIPSWYRLCATCATVEEKT